MLHVVGMSGHIRQDSRESIKVKFGVAPIAKRMVSLVLGGLGICAEDLSLRKSGPNREQSNS